MHCYKIAIDGPAGAGKSTIAKLAAKELGFIYVDTGAMYRALALLCIRNNIDSTDTDRIESICENADVSIRYENKEQQILLNGENVNGLIRTPEVGNMASSISVIPKVRLKLVELQRDLAKKESVVMDGRDIGSYVLKDAELKIYMTASSEVRAKRRYDELKEKQIACDLETIEREIIERDERDMNRAFAPLVCVPEAYRLDTSAMSVQEAVKHVTDAFARVKERN